MQPVHLPDLAGRPGVDPCDVAVDAMPARVLGDLDQQDTTWLEDHCAECDYCQDQFRCFLEVDKVLDRIGNMCAQVGAPPAVSWPNQLQPVWFTRVESPVGPLQLSATGSGLCEISYLRSHTEQELHQDLVQRGLSPRLLDPTAPVSVHQTIDRATRQLREYFHGDRTSFDVPLDFQGLTPFTRSVLEATSTAQFGSLETYRSIAERIGKPRATRAVGNALGKNPLPVIVPCHRIIRSDATIGGYTGGLWIKEQLLALEGSGLPQRVTS